MERTMSVDEKIRRAEQIYANRHKESTRPIATVSVNENKKDIKLLKKMFIQILISVMIYFCIYTIQNKEYVFSQDFINKANEVLSYDTNFREIYENAKSMLQGLIPKNDKGNQNDEVNQNDENTEGGSNETNEENNNVTDENAIGGADETLESSESKEEPQEIAKELTLEEQEIETIKNTASFIRPLDGGIVSSGFGQRESTNANIPTNHTGTDIAANPGTKIKSATDGEVVLVSSQGDYGKHIKIQIGDVSIIYAHCNAMYVKEGEKVTQGQEIGEVGSTGNSTRTTLAF